MTQEHEFQLEWAHQNKKRLNPGVPPAQGNSDLKSQLCDEYLFAVDEGKWIEGERQLIAGRAAQAPRDGEGFIHWFEELESSGPGQNDPLFPYLRDEASVSEMSWFLRQEVAGEAGFEDLVAMTQVKMPTQVKLEMARNYWDEMGRGSEKGMHGPMLTRLADELHLNAVGQADIVTEALSLANLMVSFAHHRRFAFHSIGALGVIELTAPGRAAQVYEGLKRLNVSATGRQYYLLHSTLDVKHSEAWNREVLKPLISAMPEVAPHIAEGALVRLQAGARCFERYRRELGLLQLTKKVEQVSEVRSLQGFERRYLL